MVGGAIETKYSQNRIRDHLTTKNVIMMPTWASLYIPLLLHNVNIGVTGAKGLRQAHIIWSSLSGRHKMGEAKGFQFVCVGIFHLAWLQEAVR